MLQRMAWAEVMRLLGRGRLWTLIAIVLAAGALFVVLEGRGPYASVTVLGDGRHLRTADYATSLLYEQIGALSLVCLVLPFAICDTFAHDRQTRYVSLLMARGASRASVLAARVVAWTTIATIAVSIVLLGMAAAALAVAPRAHGDVGDVSPVLPELLQSAPVAYFAVLGALAALACAATASVGLLVGVFVRSRLTAILLPPILLLATQLLPLSESQIPYSPGARATFMDYYAPWATPGSTAVYWVIFLLAISLIAVAIYRRKEDV